jgi:hypothetical protein
MRYYNPIYTRKWTKMFVPISTFFIQLGEKNMNFYFFITKFDLSRINLCDRKKTGFFFVFVVLILCVVLFNL